MSKDFMHTYPFLSENFAFQSKQICNLECVLLPAFNKRSCNSLLRVNKVFNQTKKIFKKKLMDFELTFLKFKVFTDLDR